MIVLCSVRRFEMVKPMFCVLFVIIVIWLSNLLSFIFKGIFWKDFRVGMVIVVWGVVNCGCGW